jgi:hypothetical protein
MLDFIFNSPSHDHMDRTSLREGEIRKTNFQWMTRTRSVLDPPLVTMSMDSFTVK